jgi:hypothetical protein
VRVSLAVVPAACTARSVGRARSCGVGGSAYRPIAPLDRAIAATTDQESVRIRASDRWIVGRDDGRISQTLI